MLIQLMLNEIHIVLQQSRHVHVKTHFLRILFTLHFQV